MAVILAEVVYIYGGQPMFSKPLAPGDLVPVVGWRVIKDAWQYTVERVTLDWDTGKVIVELT